MTMNLRLLPVTFAGALLAAGCASSSAPPAGDKPYNQPTTETGRATQVVTSPLADLNVVRASIPPALVSARAAPYADPADRSCAGIAAQVHALDAVLGADLDRPVTPDDPSLLHRGQTMAHNEAWSALKSTAEGAVPFRGWVRKLSGAERYSNEVQASIEAGAIRRGYLKGLGKAAGCEAPAAPRAAGPSVAAAAASMAASAAAR
jgi:hypothetical protein